MERRCERNLLALEKAARIAKCSLLPNRPYHVQWLITRKCNYRCKGCNVWREQEKKELSTEEVKKGLDILRKLGTVEIVFSGGAPLLREDIDEILEYASRFFVITVYDNGSLAGEKIEALRNADFVAISLDTLDAEKNDEAKGVKGAFDKAMEAIEKLHKEGISVAVSPTISQMNLHEMADFTRYFAERNIPLWYCLYSYDVSADSSQLFKIGKRNETLEIADKEAMVNLCDALIKLKKKNSNILITTKLLQAMKQLYLTGERVWKCRALQTFFMIDHMGRVAGCHLRKPVASIFDLPSAWNSPRFNALRETYHECRKCTYLCYIFYSLHGGVLGNLQIAQDRWRNAGMLLKKKNVMAPSLAR
ncbi:MAG: radical SAM protein [Candidatus Bathyarchaeia archaeon]